MRHLPKVDETTLGEEDEVTAIGHRVAINLGLDVHALSGVLLQPCNVDLNIEVANASNSSSASNDMDKTG